MHKYPYRTTTTEYQITITNNDNYNTVKYTDNDFFSFLFQIFCSLSQILNVCDIIFRLYHLSCRS